MATIMAKVNRSKIEPEIANLKVASSFTEWTFKKLIKDLEGFIEKDVQIKHKKIANQIERLLEENEKLAPFMTKHGIKDSQLLEYPLAILIQSGGNYSINKFNAECDDQYIQADIIYVNVCAKYTDMQAMASRSLLFNSTDAQKAAYELIFEAEMHLISKLKPGVKISEAYTSTVDMIKSKDPKLVN